MKHTGPLRKVGRTVADRAATMTRFMLFLTAWLDTKDG